MHGGIIITFYITYENISYHLFFILIRSLKKILLFFPQKDFQQKYLASILSTVNRKTSRQQENNSNIAEKSRALDYTPVAIWELIRGNNKTLWTKILTYIGLITGAETC